jgi:hypothetical protein
MLLEDAARFVAAASEEVQDQSCLVVEARPRLADAEARIVTAVSEQLPEVEAWLLTVLLELLPEV